jgi:hypothetical protein
MKINTTKLRRLGSLVGIALLTLAVPATPAIAGQGNLGNPGIVAPHSSFRGLTYSEWAEEWFRWVFSLPVSHHPFFDTADCSTGQTDNVWFIGGSLGGNRAVIRDCTVPPGTALFLPFANAWWDNEGCNGDMIQKTNFTEAQLRSFVQASFISAILDKHSRIIIDGREVEGMPTNCNSTTPASCESPYRVQTSVFDYASPAFDSILIPVNGSCYIDPNNNGQPYTVTGAVAEGVHVMIKPLPVGNHTILFGPPDSVTGLPRSRYNITVSKAGHKHEHEHEKRGFH